MFFLLFFLFYFKAGLKHKPHKWHLLCVPFRQKLWIGHSSVSIRSVPKPAPEAFQVKKTKQTNEQLNFSEASHPLCWEIETRERASQFLLLSSNGHQLIRKCEVNYFPSVYLHCHHIETTLEGELGAQVAPGPTWSSPPFVPSSKLLHLSEP